MNGIETRGKPLEEMEKKERKFYEVNDFDLSGARFEIKSDGTIQLILTPEHLAELKVDIAEVDERKAKYESTIEKCETYKEAIIDLLTNHSEPLYAYEVIDHLKIQNIERYEMYAFLEHLSQKNLLIHTFEEDDTNEGVFTINKKV